jgi:hypothetical protein
MVWILIIAFALMIAVGGAAAQESPYIPAIVEFDAVTSGEPVTRSAVEDGAVTATLNWHIVNWSDDQTVLVEYLQGNIWQPAWLTFEVVQPVGSREVVVQDPLNFGSPTFRLTLSEGRSVLEQRYLVIPFEENMSVPEVTFTSPVTALDPEEILDTTAVVVSWDVTNRPEGSQLVFDQVLPDGSQINVELARPRLFVPSSGTGAVQPRLPAGATDITFRLSVVDAISGDVYASAGLVIPLTTTAETGDVAATAAPTAIPAGPEVTPDVQTPQVQPTVAPPPETPQVLPPAPTEEIAVQGPEIETFTVTPTTIAAGGSVTMTWNVIDAATVQISEVLPDGAGLTYVQLPGSGSVSVPLPSGATTSVTYILTARDADGGESTAEQTVTIEG